MKIARFETGGREFYGIVGEGGLVPSAKFEGDLPEDLFELFTSEVMMNSAFRRALEARVPTAGQAVPLSRVKLLSPIPRPGKIVCLGRNYLEHIAESSSRRPEGLMIFLKPSTAVAGPFDDIPYPSLTRSLDYEGELGVVIGKRCKKVDSSAAMECVLGYLVFNDVSARDLQFGDGQWTRGKGCDGFAPMGPWVTTLDEVRNPLSLRLKTWVNGEVRQEAITSSMIRNVPEVVSMLSQGMTLEAGDVIATGTPAGVGYYWKPEPRMLKPGDTVRIEIEDLGHIENRIVAEA